MDVLQFYILFNSISNISGQQEGDNERLCGMESNETLFDAESSSISSKNQTQNR